MDLIFTFGGMVTFTILVASMVFYTRSLPLGAISLPSLTALTSIVYFFVMPAATLGLGSNGLLGMYISSLEWLYWALFLYTIGAVAAFALNFDILRQDPAQPRPVERTLNNKMFFLLLAMACGAIVLQILMGRLRIQGFETEGYSSGANDSFLFISLFYSMLIPLSLLYLVKSDFSIRSIVFLLLVMLVSLQVAFRYRLVILALGAVGCYALTRKIRPRLPQVLVAAVVGITLVNLVGMARQGRGGGIDMTTVQGLSWSDLFLSFGGEVGIVYVLAYTAEANLPDMVMFEPWIVGIARLVPSAIWPDKPTADYLRHFISGFGAVNADKAGIAAPQQVEMLLQFGWPGLPFLALLYFAIACLLIKRFNLLGREARIVGCAMVPSFFGFYMQTRGYFFQILADAIFIFGPLFAVHIWDGKASAQSPARAPMPVPRKR